VVTREQGLDDVQFLWWGVAGWARGVMGAVPVAALAWRGVLVAEMAHLGSCILSRQRTMRIDKVCASAQRGEVRTFAPRSLTAF
jgi:hypothetical protein